MQTGTTRRRFLLSMPLSVSAVPVYTMSRASQANAAPDDGGSLVELSATEAVSLLRSGELSAERYAQALLDQCRKHRALNAFIWQNEEQVLEAARAADKNRTIQSMGPIHGVPILVKANIATANAPTSAGTPGLRDHRPAIDAPVVAKLLSAGAVALGKTNMHELAYIAVFSGGGNRAGWEEVDAAMRNQKLRDTD